MNLTIDACDELIKLALAATSTEAFVSAATPLIDSFGVLSFGFVRHDTYWRARIIEDKRYDLLKQVDYPPAELVKSPGRLNNISDPYFYMSSTLETAVAEVRPEPGQLVQVAGYRVAPKETLQLILVGEYYNVYKRGFTSYWGDDPGGTIGHLIDKLPKQHVRTHLLIDSFLAHVISDKDAYKNEYLHSRALRDLLISKGKAHGIAFPSVRDLGGMNFGVQPEPSDKLLRNVSCVVVRAGKTRTFGSQDISYLSVASGLSSDKKSFVWSQEENPTRFLIYNITQEELDRHRKSNA